MFVPLFIFPLVQEYFTFQKWWIWREEITSSTKQHVFRWLISWDLWLCKNILASTFLLSTINTAAAIYSFPAARKIIPLISQNHGKLAPLTIFFPSPIFLSLGCRHMNNLYCSMESSPFLHADRKIPASNLHANLSLHLSWVCRNKSKVAFPKMGFIAHQFYKMLLYIPQIEYYVVK